MLIAIGVAAIVAIGLATTLTGAGSVTPLQPSEDLPTFSDIKPRLQ